MRHRSVVTDVDRQCPSCFQYKLTPAGDELAVPYCSDTNFDHFDISSRGRLRLKAQYATSEAGARFRLMTIQGFGSVFPATS